MKKLLTLIVGLALAFLVSSAALAENMTVNLGVDFGGTHAQGTDKYTNAGISIGAEYNISQLAENLSWGVGLEYQLSRTNYDTSAGTFSFIPVYVAGTYQIRNAESGLFIPFVTARLGYNFLSGDSNYKNDVGNDLKGGIYYSVGGGVSLANLAAVKLLYDINTGSATNNITYSKLRLLCSYSF